MDNTLVGLGLSCQDADIARYDSTLGEWYCDADIDTNTQLSEGQVETFVTNGSINLATNSKVNGSNIVTVATDQNTQKLSEGQVETFITNGSIGLANGSTMGGSTIVTTSTDQNTQLSESQVETFVTNGSIGLANGSTMGGSTIVTTATDSDTLDGLNCSTDEIAKWNGSAWACAADDAGSGSGGGLSYSAMYQRTSASGWAQCDDAD